LQAAGSSNKLVHFYETTQYNIPEKRNFQSLLSEPPILLTLYSTE